VEQWKKLPLTDESCFLHCMNGHECRLKITWERDGAWLYDMKPASWWKQYDMLLGSGYYFDTVQIIYVHLLSLSPGCFFLHSNSL